MTPSPRLYRAMNAAHSLWGAGTGMSLPTRKCCLQDKDTVLSDPISRPPIHHQAPDASSCPLEAHRLSKPTPAIIPSIDAYLHPPPRPKLLDLFITPPSTRILWGLHPPTGLSFPFAQTFNTRLPQPRHMHTTRPARNSCNRLVDNCC